MTNKEIASTFRELGKIMELHGENKFKVRSYSNAYLTLRKMDQPVAELTEEELAGIKGIGKAISSKIRELVTTGQMATLEKYREITPAGVQDMLRISGFGPSKVKTVWKDLGAETIGELLYAVNENRLIELKGFGKKTQEDLKTKLEYFQLSQGQFRYATLFPAAKKISELLQESFPSSQVAECGALRRKMPVLTAVEFLLSDTAPAAASEALELTEVVHAGDQLTGLFQDTTPVALYFCEQANWGSRLFELSAAPEFLEAFLRVSPAANWANKSTEEEVFSSAQLSPVPAELRESEWGFALAKDNQLPQLINPEDVLGVIHSHTTYSDGLHSLEEMVEYSKDQGYQYIGITDHSKSAFYANGLSPERVWQQMEVIDQLNGKLTDFRVFKGIESDILADGSLDYEEDVLKAFDFIIASVHSNLRMDEQKATTRLIRAIENPYTSILGHPTGRLLLSRPGYPIDHQKVIDACAANQVAIELNASPYRLDLDWSWIPYALEKGVLISINPDAHSREGIHDIYFGTMAARKGGLSVDNCLNARSAEAFYQIAHKG